MSPTTGLMHACFDATFEREMNTLGYYDPKARTGGWRASSLFWEIGISHRAFFLGLLKADDVPTELESSDILVRPSLAEGLPVSITEGMAVGVPVIATNVGGNRCFLTLARVEFAPERWDL
jgi:glycosyltransferase involved in cell wall biosynthesis